MIKQLTATALSVLSILTCTQGASADGLKKSYDLSPATEIISENLEMKRCVALGGELRFDGRDFEEVLGRSVEYITVKSLPDPTLGTLTLAGSAVREEQSLSRRNLALLRFSPRSKTGSAVFEFSADGEDCSALCTVNVLEDANLSPRASDMRLSAVSGVELIRGFDAADPDGDGMVLEIAEYPKGGTVRTVGSSFVYTAARGFTGRDSFVYRVTDSNGDACEATVTLSVTEPSADTYYGDMQGHWGHTSAVRMAGLGLMNGDADGNFNPQDGISRGDFLAMAMICAGLEDKVTADAKTVFADDSEIPRNVRSYASYAVTSGIISGYRSQDGTAVFGSSGEITRAEAASVLANILGESPRLHDFDFRDVAAIPVWARDSFSSLVSLGIISGTPDGTLEPDRLLTRAEAAQLLCNVTDFIEEKSLEEEKPKGLIGRIVELIKG